MEEEFELGGQTAVESDLPTLADLAKHFKETRYCEAQFDSEGRKIVGVRGKSTVDSHIKEGIVKLECKSGEKRQRCGHFQVAAYSQFANRECRQLSYRQSYQSQREHVFADCSFEKVLDRIGGPVLYKKGCALTRVAHCEEKLSMMTSRTYQKIRRNGSRAPPCMPSSVH